MGKSKAKSAPRRRGRTSRAETGFKALEYMDDVHRPVTCLVFLLPMVVLYEAGMLYVSNHIESAQAGRVIAFQLLQKFLALFGATGYYLPGLATVAILVAWHVAAGDKWKVRGRTLLGMLLESTMLAIPLLVLSHVASSHSMVMQASTGTAHTWLGQLLLSVGAGIYEELLFRLIFISVMSILLMDLLNIGEGPAMFSRSRSACIITWAMKHSSGTTSCSEPRRAAISRACSSCGDSGWS